MGTPPASSITTPPPGARREPGSPAGAGGPVRDRIRDPGVAVWTALGKAHRGRVTNLADQWRDCGHPVPSYLADALDRLTSSGQLAIADPDPQSRGARPVTVTDTGYTRYLTLCQIYTCPDSGGPPAGSTRPHLVRVRTTPDGH